jgi:hypothetical protein
MNCEVVAKNGSKQCTFLYTPVLSLSTVLPEGIDSYIIQFLLQIVISSYKKYDFCPQNNASYMFVTMAC